MAGDRRASAQGLIPDQSQEMRPLEGRPETVSPFCILFYGETRYFAVSLSPITETSSANQTGSARRKKKLSRQAE